MFIYIYIVAATFFFCLLVDIYIFFTLHRLSDVQHNSGHPIKFLGLQDANGLHHL